MKQMISKVSKIDDRDSGIMKFGGRRIHPTQRVFGCHQACINLLQLFKETLLEIVLLKN